MVPTVRSSHTSQETSTFFRVGDSEETCEGVAGRAWFKNGLVSVHGLPDLDADKSIIAQRDYSAQTFDSVDRIEKKMPRARSLLAVPIPKAGGPWGV